MIHFQGIYLFQKKIFYLLFEKGSTLKGQNLLPLAVDPLSKVTWCAGKQTGSHKSCLPYKQWQRIYQVYPVPLISMSASLGLYPQFLCFPVGFSPFQLCQLVYQFFVLCTHSTILQPCLQNIFSSKPFQTWCSAVLNHLKF